MQVLIKFDYNNKNYLVSKEDGKILFKVNNSLDITLEDKRVFNKVINSLVPTKADFIHRIRFNNTYLDIFKDKVKGIYMFTPFNKDILEKFNTTFNNQNEYFAINFDIKNNGFYKRIVNIGSKVVVVLLSINLSLTLTPVVDASNNLVSNDENVVSIIEVEEEFKKNNVDNEIVENVTTNSDISSEQKKEEKGADIHSLMIRALLKNPNMLPEEKVTFYNMEAFIEDNLNRIDLETYFNLVKTVDFTYKGDDWYAGAYYFGCNFIDYSNVKNISEVDASTLTHELLHMFQPANNDSILVEAVNTIINNDYFITNEIAYDSAYRDIVNYIRTLMDIIGVEPFRTFEFTGDKTEIMKSLYKIIPDEKVCSNFMETLSLYHSIRYSKGSNFSDNLEELNMELMANLNEFYKAKYGKEMETNPLISMRFRMFSSEDIIEYFGINTKEVLDNGAYFTGLSYGVYKNYFNSKKNHNSYIVFEKTYSDGSRVNEMFEITDDLVFDFSYDNSEYNEEFGSGLEK